ncbi:MAG: phosphonate C-P lyase system protein PhnH [Symplocastrum torsivum CPER-KK1]|uniref:Phosphonate C-P lyase system protein PhnH n=1 Tax=Symplocastrum torsivum CPER-KK1 TaxID=450513 RepID=A0A951PNM8_9CYAN|nr:phosphonate C-P lyase system protein PhnH [Symplocastrum torsivum CPER-KK1]
MQVPQLPGFKNPVHDAQTTFRNLLEALANPGSQHQITALVEAPAGLNSACAAACLTLLDLETQVWLQPTIEEEVKNWLLFHSGCEFTTKPNTANFAIINHWQSMPSLSVFNQGTDEEPEASTTLLIQVENFESGKPVNLSGPGIEKTRSLTVHSLNSAFWEGLTNNIHNYPLGVDIFLFTRNTVVGLPRTTRANRNKSLKI